MRGIATVAVGIALAAVAIILLDWVGSARGSQTPTESVKSETFFGGIQLPSVVALEGGRIVAVGCRDGRYLAVAYTRFGALDRTFGRRGVKTFIPVGTTPREGCASTVFADRRGGIIIGGDLRVRPFGRSVIAVRLKADGSRDRSFGTDGVALLEGDVDGGLALLRSGQIVLVGSTREGAIVAEKFDLFGRADSSFGVAGRAEVDVGAGAILADAKLQDDGKIVVAGSRRFDSSGLFRAFINRVDSQGALDPSFDASALITDRRPSRVSDIVIDGAGRIAVVAQDCRKLDQTCVARLTPEGSVDPTFGENGNIRLRGLVKRKGVSGLSLTPENGYLLTAYNVGLVLTRVNSDGIIDSSFGKRGVRELRSLATSVISSQAVRVLPSGKMLVAAYQKRRKQSGVAKLNRDGNFARSFGFGGFTARWGHISMDPKSWVARNTRFTGTL